MIKKKMQARIKTVLNRNEKQHCWGFLKTTLSVAAHISVQLYHPSFRVNKILLHNASLWRLMDMFHANSFLS